MQARPHACCQVPLKLPEVPLHACLHEATMAIAYIACMYQPLLLACSYSEQELTRSPADPQHLTKVPCHTVSPVELKSEIPYNTINHSVGYHQYNCLVVCAWIPTMHAHACMGAAGRTSTAGRRAGTLVYLLITCLPAPCARACLHHAHGLSCTMLMPCTRAGIPSRDNTALVRRPMVLCGGRC